MRKVLLTLIVMVFATTAYAADLSQSALQGDWVITEFHGSPEPDGDMWQFEGQNFYQNIAGRRMSPDAFTVSPAVIDLGYAKITVTRFDSKEMDATMAGFTYKLIKK
ncbi:hypothetical protein ACVFI8_08990 [Agarivorans sp. MS3-6]|uniref:hypothetical protein n=1 Tax=Agarivorans sp. TSD2052 TaxID=2937286 RepID=UPI00200D72B9|nr:hypothetical protein [Agarivorans sp. TSD2052]UPW18876.1 hypothetical protein M0C34_00955 [Agarivorans sp. TSD2052]